MDRSESFNNLNQNQNNDNGSTTSNTGYNLISSINTNTTHIADSTTASGSSLTTSTSNSPNNNNNNDNQQQTYMEHLAQYSKMANTLARGQFIDARYANGAQLIDNQMNIMPTQAQLASQPTAAFLVQTPTGSALLIPPTNNFHTLNSFSLNRQNYMTTSPSVTSGTFRPESNPSQNVYQTIDAEKNGYLYPIDGAFDSNTTFTNTCSTRSKFKKSFQHQQQAHLAKLIENSHNTARTNSNGYFSSTAESSMSARNRRHLDNSILERLKFGLSKKLEKSCSWKCFSFLLIIIIFNLFLFTIYLAIMKKYNLNWHLKDQKSEPIIMTERNPVNLMLFTKIGDTIEDQIEPNDLFNMQFYLDTSSYIKFNLSISRKSQIGFYADKGTPPSFTKFKIFETFNSNSVISSQKKNLINTGFVHYLNKGLWYISLLNDNKNSIKFRLKTNFHSKLVSNCENNCFGKGECINNKCECFPGYTGSDCSQIMCPIVCSGHGKYENGKCNCETQWHGDECEIPIDQCQVKDCNKNGECMNGICMCYSGYTGEFCQTKACKVPDCSNNGVCISGECKCFSNYTGSDCSIEAKFNTNLCSSNGVFNYERKSCDCLDGWKGPDCSVNQNCLDNSCSKCKNGWSGVRCMQKVIPMCDSRCNAHGLCINGTCSCSPGYQGRNCDINSCPNGCSSHGICESLPNNGYQCVCNPGWTGKACEVGIEMVCNDDIDNDGDGLTDCLDSECCVFDNCKLSLACQSAPEPKDRLLRKQPPSLSASFFDKMRFLIEDSSVQSFAFSNSFIESQVSVIRGQVLFKNGQPLIGVKVTSYKNPIYGYTLTRNNGIFDLMVNGGGSIQLEFSRNRLRTKVITINTAWNQFVYIDPVMMYLSEDLNQEQNEPLCPNMLMSKPTVQFRPIVRTNWKEIPSSYETSSIIVPDTGVIRSEIQLNEPNLKLIYSSNLVQGFSSSIFVQLTGSRIPDELQMVHLEISVEGVLFSEKFDAYPNIKYEYSWDRRNAYEQRVYGMTTAKVKVGYQYEECSLIDWQTQTVKIAGYDLGSSEVGNWNLNIHHRLNTQLGILHKGDGSTIYLKELQKTIEHVIKLDSEGVYLEINRDGTIFVADSNFIWMINSTDQPRQIFTHYMNNMYMTSDPIDGSLYLNNPGEKKIISIKSMDRFVDELRFNSRTNLDGLKYPKGLAFDNNKNLFFIDSNTIKVYKNGVTRDVIVGGQKDRPVDCKKIFHIDNKFSLYWPTVLAVNPIDNSLYILDDEIVYRLGMFNTLEVIAGKPYFCADDDPNFVKLHNPIDITFSPDGELFILENDANNKINQIRLVKPTGQIQVYFTNLQNPKSIRVHQNRSIYVLDSSNLFQIKNTVVRDEYTGKYTVVSTDTKEAFVFNRFGLHLNTIDLNNGRNLYNFTYNGNALYGKLIQISDQNRILINIKRDFNGRVSMMQLSDQVYQIKLNNFNMIKSLTQTDKTIKLNYLGNGGLLVARVQAGTNNYFFKYEKSGKVKQIVENIGSENVTLGFDYDLTEQGLITSVTKGNGVETWLTNSSGLFIFDSNKKVLEYKYDFNINYKTVLYDDLINLF